MPQPAGPYAERPRRSGKPEGRASLTARILEQYRSDSRALRHACAKLGSKCRDLPGRPGRQGGETPAADRGGEHWQGAFGLWRARFPPCLVRPGRRLPVPVQGLSEGSLGFLELLDRLPA